MIECPPDVEILRRFYAKEEKVNEVESLFEGFERLNTRLAEELDRHHTIGQTFFMADEFTAEKLKKIWERKLYPLIEEYFFDQEDLAKQFTLKEFWPDVE